MCERQFELLATATRPLIGRGCLEEDGKVLYSVLMRRIDGTRIDQLDIFHVWGDIAQSAIRAAVHRYRSDDIDGDWGVYGWWVVEA